MLSLKRNILRTSTTVDQAHYWLDVWQRVAEQAMFTADKSVTISERYQEAILALENAEEKKTLLDWDKDWLSVVNPEEFPEYVAEMRAWLKHVPTFVLYVPALLDAAGVKMIHDWVIREMGEEWLMDLRVSANTLGGCAFITNERYYDYSLHGQLQRNPEVVRETLRSYEKKT